MHTHRAVIIECIRKKTVQTNDDGDTLSLTNNCAQLLNPLTLSRHTLHDMPAFAIKTTYN